MKHKTIAQRLASSWSAGALVAASLLMTSAHAWEGPEDAEFGDFQVRFRGILINPFEDKGLEPIGGSVRISEEFVPELDFTLFLTKSISVELIAAIAEHDIEVQGSPVLESVGLPNGDLTVGNVLVLPPTLLAQYHFDLGRFQPYVGAGVNFTGFFDEDAATGGPVIDFNLESSIGPALQAGVDYFISENWFLNLDAKFIFMDTDVVADTTLGPVTGNLNVNPLVIGGGVGYRF